MIKGYSATLSIPMYMTCSTVYIKKAYNICNWDNTKEHRDVIKFDVLDSVNRDHANLITSHLQ